MAYKHLSDTPHSLYHFPENFYWGASTASHQVEGNTHNDWSEWETSPRRLQDLESIGAINVHGRDNFISGRGADHYTRFHEDFALARTLGHNATRFSIEWSRIEPEEGKFDQAAIDHYREVLATLKKQGIEAFVTLWHWPIPLWLRDKGGWESNTIVDYFKRYVAKIVTEFQREVTFWITLNEIEVYASNSYLNGVWPPQKRSKLAYWRVTNNLIKAHQHAYSTIKSIAPEAQVGIAKNNCNFEAADSRFINRALRATAHWWWNSYFLNKIQGHQDFIGLNHYFHNLIDHGLNKNRNKRTSDLGWELHPESMYHVLTDLKRYNKPVYITENGLADAEDQHRSWFIVETLKQVHRAIQEGVNVRGYLHWSLMDNFEWDKGFWPRFGLIAINYKTLERTPRPSALLYRDICLANGITPQILRQHRAIIAK